MNENINILLLVLHPMVHLKELTVLKLSRRVPSFGSKH